MLNRFCKATYSVTFYVAHDIIVSLMIAYRLITNLLQSVGMSVK